MLTQMADGLIEQTPSLSVWRTVSAKWYIINRWNQTHDESINEGAVMLFLCDENKGELTEEQRTFAKARKAEVYGSFALTILDSLLYQEMHRQGLVSGLEDFWSVIAPRRVTANPLPVPPA